jgi:hypothetical protein
MYGWRDVWMNVYMCMYVWLRIKASMIWTRMYVCMYICMYVCMYVYMSIYGYSRVHMYVALFWLFILHVCMYGIVRMQNLILHIYVTSFACMYVCMYVCLIRFAYCCYISVWWMIATYCINVCMYVCMYACPIRFACCCYISVWWMIATYCINVCMYVCMHVQLDLRIVVIYLNGGCCMYVCMATYGYIRRWQRSQGVRPFLGMAIRIWSDRETFLHRLRHFCGVIGFSCGPWLHHRHRIQKHTGMYVCITYMWAFHKCMLYVCMYV